MFHLFGIGVHVMFTILAEVVKLLCILIHSVVTLLKSKHLFHLSNHESFWDVVVLESFLELHPSDFMSSGLHGLKMLPPH
jgi:1-acyl-sn-glycerol-3-phosphate acyltransferase